MVHIGEGEGVVINGNVYETVEAFAFLIAIERAATGGDGNATERGVYGEERLGREVVLHGYEVTRDIEGPRRFD